MESYYDTLDHRCSTSTRPTFYSTSSRSSYGRNSTCRNIPPSGELELSSNDGLSMRMQHRSCLNPVIDIRRMGLETLHQILQSGAHGGWETIFDMLGSVCKLINNPPLAASSSAPSRKTRYLPLCLILQHLVRVFLCSTSIQMTGLCYL